MNDEVLVSVKSRQLFDGMSTEFAELIAPGKMTGSNGGYVITYCENDPETFGETLTTVTAAPDGLVTVVREGDIESEMVFERGRKHIFHYDTSEGSMTMGISTKKLGVSLGDSGGRIDIEYTIEIENAVAYENLLNMNITRPQTRGIVS